ncbi:MAG: hypothetical protein IE920_08775 [Thiotrichales bacterium]|nr:hypothetical protein [Thiotrichales bacterium]
MTIFEMILMFVGVVLLALALFSGIKLFQKASREDADENNGGMGSLWLLFIIGILGGLLFIWLSMNNIDSGVVSWSIVGVLVVAGILGVMTLLG